MIIDKEGKLIATTAQMTMCFDTKEQFTAFLNTLPDAPSGRDKETYYSQFIAFYKLYENTAIHWLQNSQMTTASGRTLPQWDAVPKQFKNTNCLLACQVANGIYQFYRSTGSAFEQVAFCGYKDSYLNGDFSNDFWSGHYCKHPDGLCFIYGRSNNTLTVPGENRLFIDTIPLPVSLYVNSQLGFGNASKVFTGSITAPGDSASAGYVSFVRNTTTNARMVMYNNLSEDVTDIYLDIFILGKWINMV